MTTWHQRQRPIKLVHATKWRVVTDPPGEPMSVMSFDDKAAAEEFLPKAGPHSYIVAPESTYAVKP
jgi:hypothetical protein